MMIEVKAKRVSMDIEHSFATHEAKVWAKAWHT